MDPNKIFKLIENDSILTAYFTDRLRILMDNYSDPGATILKKFKNLVPERMHEEINSNYEMQYIQKEDMDAFETIFRNFGVVYGGYLRDYFDGVKPKDIDIVVPDIYKDRFLDELKGYTFRDNLENGTVMAERPGHRDIEISFCEDEPEDNLFIGPCAEPDFDVNLLTYDGKKLYNWVDPTIDTILIIERIYERRAKKLSNNVGRMKKMHDKGYRIET